jgi:hypothetical protein
LSRVFFTDRDLGTRFPEILRSAGLPVERHADHFAHDTKDETWLADIGARGWVVLTHDRRIRYKPNELAAVKRHRVAMLVVVSHAPYHELADAFVVTYPRILSFLERHEPPFIGKVSRPSPAERQRDPSAPGRVELWYPRQRG